jgi:hypothetical protein
MVVSSRFGAGAPSVKHCPEAPSKRRGVRSIEPAPLRLNETGMTVSEKVHLGEIVVIPGSDVPSG